MSNIISIWNQFSLQKKAILAAVLIVTIAVFALLINLASKPRMAFLYGGLDPSSAGEVLSTLEAMDVIADVRGDAIYVPETRRDAIRMTLARQGLPQQGQPGFELLDEMNSFATTSEMFDATYWRAKEGEIARTIVTSPGIKSARIHLAVPKSSSFSRRKRSPTASATITMSRGRLELKQATAIRFLVALAVSDLDPEQVAIIDSIHGVILKPGASTPALEFGGGDESDRVHRLEEGLINLIEARVGPGNARVTISMKIDREHETVSERILDPESRVMMGRETSDVQQSDVGGTGAVTVASNLPDGEADADKSPSQSSRSEATENARFEISEVHRQREKMPGAVSRINVAVLINELAVSDDATAPTNRTLEELDAIRDLIATAVGFDEARGDVVTVKAMTFHEIELGETEVEAGGIMQYMQENLISILQILIPAFVVLALAMFVVRPILTQSAPGPVLQAPPIGELTVAPQAVSESAQALSPVDALRDVAGANQEVTTKVLKSWLGSTEQAA